MLVHTRRIEEKKFLVTRTVYKSIAHDATLKIGVILFLLQDARI